MNKKVISIIMAFTMVLSTFFYIPTSFAAERNNGYGEYAYSVLKHLDKNLPKRIGCTDQEQKTAEYLKKQLESFGYKVEIQKFSFSKSKTDKKIYNSQNVVATKKGISDKQIIVGSHYDSVNTNGVDDNGSGVAANLETARRLANKKTPYTIKFAFFGDEEQGYVGSNYYFNRGMTDEDHDNAICMINIDSILAGTYRYVYSGNYNEKTKKVDDAWPAYQVLKLSRALGSEIRLNNTKFNKEYPTPSTGDWSDHANFRKGMPYLYFEASNWELPDNPKKPKDGTSGGYETEKGRVMHNPKRDNLKYIESTWGNRGKKTLTAYCKLLEAILYQLSPDGLKTPVKNDLQKAIKKANKLSKNNFSKANYRKFKQVLKEAKKVNRKKYILLKDQSVIDKATENLNRTMKITN